MLRQPRETCAAQIVRKVGLRKIDRPIECRRLRHVPHPLPTRPNIALMMIPCTTVKVYQPLVTKLPPVGCANPGSGLTCHHYFTRYIHEDSVAPTPTLYGKSHQPRELSKGLLRPLRGGSLCLDFINTVENHDQAGGYDDLTPGYANIIDWSIHAGAVDEAEANSLLRHAAREPREAAAVRSRATTLRHALYEVVTSLIAATEPPDGSLELFNQEWRLAMMHGRYIPVGDGLAWQWCEGRDLDRVLWELTRSAAELLSGDHIARVRQCAAPTCQSIFLDTSRNGSRRFCSAATCGTATRVRRFRARQVSVG